MNQGHLHPPSLRILVLFNFNSNHYFIKHCNRFHSIHRRRWRRYHDHIILCIKLCISFEHHQTFSSQPRQLISHKLIGRQKNKRKRKTNFDTNTPRPFLNVLISFFRHFQARYLLFSLLTSFQSQSNIKFDTSSSYHLSHAVPTVNI